MNGDRPVVVGAAGVIITSTEVRAFLDKSALKQFSVYGLLLTPNTVHPFTTIIGSRWDALHNMTGKNFLVLASPPDAFSEDFKS
jgi:hypothetical protein